MLRCLFCDNINKEGPYVFSYTPNAKIQSSSNSKDSSKKYNSKRIVYIMLESKEKCGEEISGHQGIMWR